MSTKNPFDFTEVFQQYDPKEVAQKIQNAFNFDVDAIKTAQNKNMELLMSTNQAIVDSSQALLQRQAEMLQQAMTEATEAAKSLAASSSPQEAAGQQAEMLQAAYEKALANSTEISAMAKKTQEEVSDKFNQRIADSLKEFEEAIAKIN